MVAVSSGNVSAFRTVNHFQDVLSTRSGSIDVRSESLRCCGRPHGRAWRGGRQRDRHAGQMIRVVVIEVSRGRGGEAWGEAPECLRVLPRWVLVLTPDSNAPIGGVKIHYQVVDALNRAGVEALVVHRKRGFHCTWFRNTTRVDPSDTLRVNRHDLLVVPEEWIAFIPGIARRCAKGHLPSECVHNLLVGCRSGRHSRRFAPPGCQARGCRVRRQRRVLALRVPRRRHPADPLHDRPVHLQHIRRGSEEAPDRVHASPSSSGVQRCLVPAAEQGRVG